MSADDNGKGGCTDAYLLLSFAVGGVIGLALVASRLIYPYKVHRPVRRH